MRIISSMLIVGLCILAPGMLWSYEPVVVLVASANATMGDDSPEPIVPAIAAGIEFDWRFTAGRTGYAALWGSAEVESNFLGGYFLDDRESLGFELGGIPSGIDITFLASVTATSGLLDTPARAEPSWNLIALIPIGSGATSAGTSYTGGLRWNESEAVERIEQRLALHALSEPSFTTAYQYALTTGLDLFPQTYLVDDSGNPTAAKRRDFVLSAKVDLDLLSDYFTRWDGEIAAGARISNATRYLASTGILEKSSEDRIFGSIAAGVGLSPASTLSLNLSLTADGAVYLGRAAVGDAGTPLGENLTYLRSTAGVTAAWSPMGRLFVIGTLNAAGALSNDSLYSGWTSTAEISAQWRL